MLFLLLARYQSYVFTLDGFKRQLSLSFTGLVVGRVSLTTGQSACCVHIVLLPLLYLAWL